MTVFYGTPPPIVAKVRQALDRAVDRLYRPEPFDADSDRVALLFERYLALALIRTCKGFGSPE